MIDNAATIANMKEAGLSAETILLALGCIVLCPPAVERSGAARRQAAYRERVRTHNALRDVDNVTHAPTDPPTPLEIYNTQVISKPTPTPSLPKNSRAHGTNPRAIGTNPRATAQDPEGFAEFWEEYPKRASNDDRKGAVKAFRAALQRAKADSIIAGAKAYAAWCRSTSKVGTEYVKQARSWLNSDLWIEWIEKTQAPPEPFTGTSNGQVFVKQGTDAFDAWSRWWRKTKGVSAPTNQDGGWFFPTEYPQEQAA